MQGFRNEFGDDGARHFIDTTDGFKRDIIRDRNDPIYPRSVVLSNEEIELYDRLVAEVIA